MRYIISILLIFSEGLFAAENIINTRTELEGTVVSSVCSIAIEGDRGRLGVIDLGQYNQATHQGSGGKTFWLKLYEEGATLPGCDAFLAGGDKVTLTFGDKNLQQLDARGVITRGAGDGVRLRISSLDANNVSSVEPLTFIHQTLSYPTSFAAKGVFGFRVQPTGLNLAKAGVYQGELSVVVSYK
ncbi:MAG: fimbrial protein [Plesiomonas shigelloides]